MRREKFLRGISIGGHGEPKEKLFGATLEDTPQNGEVNQIGSVSLQQREMLNSSEMEMN